MDACNIKRDYGSGSRQQRHLARCNMCGITAHSLRVSWQRKILNIDALNGMSCFEIAHSDHCMGLWIGKGGQTNMMIRQGKTFKKQAYRVSITHLLYRSLMESYGCTPNVRNTKKRRGKGVWVMTVREITVSMMIWGKMMMRRMKNNDGVTIHRGGIHV